jgi:DNA-directed RNA polymerase specialized sigma24 family protein
MVPPDEQLLGLFAAVGEGGSLASASMADIYDQCVSSVFGWFRANGFDRHTSEDFAHDVMVKLLQDPKRLSAIKSPRAFIYTIAANLAKDAWKQRRRRKTVVGGIGHSDDTDDLIGIVANHLSRNSDYDGNWRDLLIDAERALDELRLRSPDQANLILLGALGLSAEEIAEATGRASAHAATQAKSEAILALRALFGGMGATNEKRNLLPESVDKSWVRSATDNSDC